MMLAKFRLPAGDISLITAKFRCRPENAAKYRLLFQRNIALNAAKFLSNFRANFRQKFARTKNEIRAFRIQDFWTILYIHL